MTILPPGFIEQVAAITGAGGYVTDPETIAPLLEDWRGNYRGHTPLLLCPGTVGEVGELVLLCARSNLALTAQGGNTGLVNAGIPYGEILLSTSRLDRIIDTDSIGDTMTVGAGAILSDIQQEADRVDRLFPLSLGSEGSATIGGLISTNAGGSAVLRYGMMRDLVLGLEVVLADGTVLSDLHGLRKNNTGYDLKQLFIGAEGTLGIVTAAVLKLFPKPFGRETAWAVIEDIDKAVELYVRMRNLVGGALTGFELIPEICLDMVLEHVPGSRDPLPASSPWRVLIDMSFFGSGGREAFETALSGSDALLVDAVLASGAGQGAKMWKLRDSIAIAERARGKMLKHDIALPIGRLAEFVRRAAGLVGEIEPMAEIIAFGHVGDGNLHYNIAPPPGVSGFNEASSGQISSGIYRLVTQLGGSISAEHGIGLKRREALAHYLPPERIRVMQAVKRALDPGNLMNPGRIFLSS